MDTPEAIYSAARTIGREPTAIPDPDDYEKSYTPRSLVGGLYAIAESIARVASVMESDSTARHFLYGAVRKSRLCKSKTENGSDD